MFGSEKDAREIGCSGKLGLMYGQPQIVWREGQGEDISKWQNIMSQEKMCKTKNINTFQIRNVIL